jgi:hypothetical protein
MPSQPPKPVILDTDPGIGTPGSDVDDSLAIALGLLHPGCSLLGLTVVAGNVVQEEGVPNALRFLEIAGRTDVPVVPGAERPLWRDPRSIREWMEARRQRSIERFWDLGTFPPPATAPARVRAAEFIADTVRARPGEVTIVAIGPCTNVAAALLLDPVEARSGELGHLQVRHDQVVPLPSKQPPGLEPIAGRVHVMTGRAEARYHQVPRALIVVDDEDAPGRETLVRQETHCASPRSSRRSCIDGARPMGIGDANLGRPALTRVLWLTVRYVVTTRGSQGARGVTRQHVVLLARSRRGPCYEGPEAKRRGNAKGLTGETVPPLHSCRRSTRAVSPSEPGPFGLRRRRRTCSLAREYQAPGGPAGSNGRTPGPARSPGRSARAGQRAAAQNARRASKRDPAPSDRAGEHCGDPPHPRRGFERETKLLPGAKHMSALVQSSHFA